MIQAGVEVTSKAVGVAGNPTVGVMAVDVNGADEMLQIFVEITETVPTFSPYVPVMVFVVAPEVIVQSEGKVQTKVPVAF